MWVQTRDFSSEKLARFKALQQRVYVVLEEVSQTLMAGDSEKVVANAFIAP